MHQLMLAIAVGTTALMSGYGTAVAQVAIEVPGAGVYVGPTHYYDDDYYTRRYYRDYRYYDDAYETRVRERRNDRNLCGRYAYWDGNSCQPGRRP